MKNFICLWFSLGSPTVVTYFLVHLLWILFASELRCMDSVRMLWFLQVYKKSRSEGSYWLCWPSMLNGRYKKESMQGLHTLLSLLHSCPRDIKLERIMLSSLSLGKILAMIFQSLTMLSGFSRLEDRINHWQTPWIHTIKEEKVSLPLVLPPPAPTLKSHAWGQVNESSFILLKRWQSALLPTWGGEVTVCTASHLRRCKSQENSTCSGERLSVMGTHLL